jgi:hypothetical protein
LIELLEIRSDDEFREFERSAVEFRKQQEKERRRTVAWIGEHPEGLEIAVATLKCCRGFHRRQTLRLLAEVGPPARSAIPEVRRLLGDSDPETRQLAREALHSIDAQAIAHRGCSFWNKGLRRRCVVKPWLKRVR